MKVAAGTVLFREGEPGEVMYLVREGRVGVLRRHSAGEETLAELGPGSILGEMSLLDRRPRSATATVIEDADLTVIDGRGWDQVCSVLPPWLAAIVRVIVDRLRETNVLKHREDVQHAMPALLFVLLKRPDSGGVHWRQAEIGAHLEALYGLARADMAKLLEFLADREMIRLVPDEADLRIECREYNLLKLTYEVLLDRSLPKPAGENQITGQEVQVLLALLDAAARHVRFMGSKTVVSLPQLQESMDLKVQDQHEFRPLIRLDQGGYIQLIPPWSPGTPITSKHNVAYEDEKVRELLALHGFLEKLARLQLD
jgi:CRP-like cAMP-binding protein